MEERRKHILCFGKLGCTNEAEVGTRAPQRQHTVEVPEHVVSWITKLTWIGSFLLN